MKTMNLTVDGDGIALIVIDLPGRPMNVMTPEFLTDLDDLAKRLASDATIKGALLTSGKTGSFVAGADLKDLVQEFDRGITPAKGAQISRHGNDILRRLETCGKPVAVAINGLALGGGFELTLACHYRVLAEHGSVGLPEVNLGLLPGGGGTQRLPRLIGIEKAAPLLLGGTTIKAPEALKLGLVHAVAPADELVAHARAWLLNSPKASQPWDEKGFTIAGGAGPLAPHAGRTFVVGTAVTAQNTQRNYPAPLAILSCIYEGTQLSIDAGLRIEAKYFGKLLASAVARNMIRTLFINKGKADKLSRRPQGIAVGKVRKLGIVGAGMMGSGIAYVSAAAGMDVVLLDSTQQAAEKGKQYSSVLLQKALARGKTTQDKVDALLARIVPTTDYAALSDVDLVVEAVFEDRKVKAEVTGKVDSVLHKGGVFASNTSTLPISSLAETFSRGADFIGLHFFSPVDKMPLVEVIKGRKTSPATLAKALDYVAQIRKTPIVVNDSPGFFTSRVISTYTQEGVLMLTEGVDPALIENAARSAGFPVGPLTIADEVSLELQLNVLRQNIEDGQLKTPDLPRVIEVLQRMVVDLKRTGRRAGAGYYEYPPNGRKHLWSGLSTHWPATAEQPGVEEVKERFLLVQALEAARCVEEGVIEAPGEGDIGSILGIGFPTWTGGVISYIDTLGTTAFVARCHALAAKHGSRFKPSAWLESRADRGENFHPPMADAA